MLSYDLLHSFPAWAEIFLPRRKLRPAFCCSLSSYNLAAALSSAVSTTPSSTSPALPCVLLPQYLTHVLTLHLLFPVPGMHTVFPVLSALPTHLPHPRSLPGHPTQGHRCSPNTSLPTWSSSPSVHDRHCAFCTLSLSPIWSCRHSEQRPAQSSVW